MQINNKEKFQKLVGLSQRSKISIYLLSKLAKGNEKE